MKKNKSFKRMTSFLLACVMLMNLSLSALATDDFQFQEAEILEEDVMLEEFDEASSDLSSSDGLISVEGVSVLDEAGENENTETTGDSEIPAEGNLEDFDFAQETEIPEQETGSVSEDEDNFILDLEEVDSLDSMAFGEDGDDASVSTATVSLTVNKQGVLASANDGSAMVLKEVAVSDLNNDGILTYDEALIAAHKTYNSEDGYATQEYSSAYGNGISVNKLWNIKTTNTMFYLNGTALSSHVGDTSNSTVKNGDVLYASVNQDEHYYSDQYTTFDVNERTVKAGEKFTLKLTAGGASAVGVMIGTWNTGIFTQLDEKTTDENGCVSLSFTVPGTYLITASGNVKRMVTTDWSSGTQEEKDCPIMAPACMVAVMPQPTMIAEGSCGATDSNEVNWKLTDDGVLTISGTGEMKNFTSSNRPEWNNYASQIKSVKIEEGIKSVGNYAFNGYTALSNIALPMTLTKIGQRAFASSGLTELEISNNVSSLGAHAFRTCMSLTNVTISNSVVSDYAFYGCTNLTTVNLGEGLATIGKQAFQNTGLKEIVIPESVSSIGKGAFQYCSALEKATLNGSVEGTSTFNYCTALKTVVIGKKLTVLTPSIFQSCASLESLTADESNNNIVIQDDMLYSSDGTTLLFCVPGKAGKVSIKNGTMTIAQSAFGGCSKITAIDLPDSITTFESNAFQGCSGLTELEFPASIKNLNGYSFRNCTSLKKIAVRGENYVVKDSIVYTKDEKTLVLCPPAYEGEVIISEGVTTIADAAFFYCSKLTNVSFPSTLIKIGEDGFCNCSAMKKALLPVSVTEIGSYVFQGCTELEEVTLSENITSIPQYMFEGCANLESVLIPSNVTSIGNRAFYGCTSLESVLIPSKVTSIGERAFDSCSSIVTIEVPDGVTEIGKYAFNGCTSLQEAVIPESVSVLREYLFGSCSSLVKVILPAELKEIELNAFAGTKTDLICAYFKGSPSQWNSIKNINWYTWLNHICYYSIPVDNDMIDVQPEEASYLKNTEVDQITPLSIRAKVQEDGVSYSFTWYQNSVNSNEGGNALENTTVSPNGRWGYCIPVVSETGNYYYYCIVEKKAENGNILAIAKSEVAQVVVKLDSFKGKGTEREPYQISSQSNLNVLYDLVSSGIDFEGIYFQMTEDIVLDDSWKSIGVLKEGATTAGNGKNINPFSGTFDGDGKTLTIAKGGVPLFGYVREAVVKNLNIYGEYIADDGLVANYTVDYGEDGSYSVGTGGSYAAGCPDTIDIINVTIKSGTTINGSGFLGGYASGGNVVNISKCTVENNVKIGWDGNSNASSETRYIGSLAGEFNGTVTNCVSYADVYGTDGIGGLVAVKGQAMGPCKVSNSQFKGTVNASGKYSGGIVGQGYGASSAPNTPGVSIQNCYVYGRISGNDYVGGIFGGEKAQAQAWDNGIGTISGNRFAGTVSGSGSYIGGIIGYMRSLNCNNVIQNNYYLASCGTSKGIGGVLYVDTSAKPHGWTEDNSTYYMNTSVDDLTLIKQETDPTNQYSSITRTGQNRTDDPLGADADNLTTCKEFIEPEEAIVTTLTVSGNYRKQYYMGESFDLSGMVFTAEWSDGSSTNLSAEEVNVTGFDSSKRGNQDVTISYNGIITKITVVVLKGVTVTFKLLGDKKHDSEKDGNIHTYATDNLEEWVHETVYYTDLNSTVYDVMKIAEEEYGFTIEARDSQYGTYIYGIIHDGEALEEFNNGRNSGWMYTINGIHPDVGVSAKYVEDGDVIVFHYTDDYTKEESLMFDKAQAAETEDAIMSLPEVSKLTSADKATVEAVRALYNALTDEQKALIAEDTLKQLEAAEARIAELTHVHTWNAGTVTKMPTCTAEGVKTFRCSCGSVKTEAIPAVGHKYSTWAVAEKATVFAPEKQKHTCSVCGHTETRYVGEKLAPVLEVPGKLTSLSIKKGKTAKFAVTMAEGDTLSACKSSKSSIVKVSSVDKKKGTVSLKALKSGTAKITISLSSGKSRVYTVKVTTGTVKTTKVTVSSKKVTLAKGKTMLLKTELKPFTSTQKVTYKSSNKKVATVTSSGKIKAIAPGTATITATSGTKKATCTVTVTGIANIKSSVTVKKNKTLTLKPKLYGITGKAVYTSSNTKVATVTANGKMKGIKKGTAVITVKAGNYSVKCKVTVK